MLLGEVKYGKQDVAINMIIQAVLYSVLGLRGYERAFRKVKQNKHISELIWLKK